MLTEAMMTLAASGAGALAAAAGTDAWNSSKAKFVKLLTRTDDKQRNAIEEELDRSAAELSTTEPSEHDAAHQRFIRDWRVRLEDFLGENPDLADELRELTSRIESQ